MTFDPHESYQNCAAKGGRMDEYSHNKAKLDYLSPSPFDRTPPPAEELPEWAARPLVRLFLFGIKAFFFAAGVFFLSVNLTANPAPVQNVLLALFPDDLILSSSTTGVDTKQLQTTIAITTGVVVVLLAVVRFVVLRQFTYRGWPASITSFLLSLLGYLVILGGLVVCICAEAVADPSGTGTGWSFRTFPGQEWLPWVLTGVGVLMFALPSSWRALRWRFGSGA